MTTSGPSALPSTEKVDPLQEFRLSSEAKKYVLRHWSAAQDTTFGAEWQPVNFRWKWPKWIRPKQRLTVQQADQVQTYINLIVSKKYPYQVRDLMGRHLWLEFCEYWSGNPDFLKAVRYL